MMTLEGINVEFKFRLVVSSIEILYSSTRFYLSFLLQLEICLRFLEIKSSRALEALSYIVRTRPSLSKSSLAMFIKVI